MVCKLGLSHWRRVHSTRTVPAVKRMDGATFFEMGLSLEISLICVRACKIVQQVPGWRAVRFQDGALAGHLLDIHAPT